MLFDHFFEIIIPFKNDFNKSVNCNYIPVKNNWFTKYIINTNNFLGKAARNVFLIFFSVWSIIFVSLPLTPFKTDSKSAWKLNGTANCLKWLLNLIEPLPNFTACLRFICKQIPLCSTKYFSLLVLLHINLLKFLI